MDFMARSLKEDYLTCVICFELFTEPKSLPCLHTFCEGCLKVLLDKSPNKLELTCQHAGKLSNYHLNQCLL